MKKVLATVASLALAAAVPGPASAGAAISATTLSAPRSMAASISCDLPGGTLTLQTIPKNAQACNAVDRVVAHDGMRLRIPPPGYGVGTEALKPESAVTFTITTAPDDTITYYIDDDPTSGALSSGLITGGPAACSDSYYNLNDAKRDSQLQWYVGDGSNPAAASDSEFAGALVRAVNHIQDANDCSMPDQVSASADYYGTTNRESEFDLVDGGYECESYFFQDGYNVVDASNLDNHGDPPVAAACWWMVWSTGYDRITSSDIRFNIEDFNFTLTPRSSGCFNDFDVQGVATHEFGHAFGMGHVAEKSHGYLTMSTSLDPCAVGARTLGKGDILGLRDLY